MADIDTIKLGKRVKELRLECGMSQKFLAQKINCTQNTISQYETGLIKPSIDVLASLAIELKTTTDYLLGLED